VQGQRSIWDVATDQEQPLDFLHRFDEPTLAFAPDGQTVASFNTSRLTVSLWDVRTGKKTQVLPVPFPGMDRTRLAFSPDSRVLATADRESETVRLWEARSGKLLGQLAGQQEGVHSLAFSPDGRLLASGGANSTVLVWDVKTPQPAAPVSSVVRTHKEMDDLWTGLAASWERQAYQAVWDLTTSPSLSVPLLRDRLKPATTVDRQRLSRLVADLDDKRFETRKKAAEELEALGDPAEEALTKLLTGQPALEVRQRAESILKKLAASRPERLRPLRAVEVLEHIGTSEARLVLDRLAQGAPENRLTSEAQAAFRRLALRGQ
jgi:hypothetical protein